MSQPYKSGRQQNLNLGITSITENRTVLQTIGKVGIGTTNAQNHSLFVVGSTNITGGINVSGIGTIETFDATTGTIDYLTNTNLNVSGATTLTNLNVSTGFDVYDTLATFHNNVRIEGNLSIGGTSTVIFAQDLKVLDKEITLGITTDAFGNDVSNDYTANHGGISIASTEGYPLVDLSLAGFSTTPATYKQLMWVAANSYGFGTTDAWMFNYAVGIGSTIVPNGTRLAVGQIHITDNNIVSPNGNLTNAYGTNLTYTTGNFTNGNIGIGIVTTIAGSNLTYTTGNFATGNIVTGVVTSLTSTNANITNINSTGITTLGIVTATQLYVSGVSTFVGISTFTNDLFIGGNLYIQNDLVFDEFTARNANITGLSTLGIASATSLFVAGVSTIATLNGSDLHYTTANLTTSNIVTGIVTTIAGSNLTYTNADIGNAYITTGIVTTIVGSNLTYTNVDVDNAYITSGIVTTIVGSNLTYNNADIDNAYITSGIVTTINGTNLNYAGVGTIATLNSTVSSLGFATASSLVVSGITTLGFATVTSLYVSGITTISGVQFTPTGIVTSSSPGITTVVYYGDGSNLIGVNAFNVINQPLTPNTVYPTFATNSGVASVGISSTQVVYIPSSNNLGIGTTNPQYTLEIVGNARISGVTSVTNLELYGTVSAASSVGNNGQYLKSTGVGVTWTDFPTLRTVSINTATSGQTTFSFSYTVGFIDVFVNGVKLIASEYTASNGSTVILSSPAFANDIVELIAYNTISTSGSGGGGGASSLNDLTDVTLTLPAEGEALIYDGSQWINDYTVTASTSSTSQTSIHTLSSSTYRSVEYTIQATQGANYHLTKILAIHDGTFAYPTEYGTVYTNGSLGTFDLDISGGNIRLLVTPSAATTTDYKIKFTAFKV